MEQQRDRISRLIKAGAIAIVRAGAGAPLGDVVKALRSGGITAVEITMTTPGVLQAIAAAANEFPDVMMGAGTVLDAETARHAILAGACFLITPTLAVDVIQVGRRYGVPVVAGAMTPTEALEAWEAGASIVKVFPANVVGPEFFRAMRGPLPQIPLAPTGGVNLDNSEAFLRAGAVAVCLGGSLVPRNVGTKDLPEITDKAERLVKVIRAVRSEEK